MRIVTHLAAAALAFSTPVARAESLAGLWLTEDREAHVRVEACSDETARFCGSLVWLAEPATDDGTPKTDIYNPDAAYRDRPIVGLEILRIDAEADGGGVYRNGSVYDPSNGKRYRCKARLVDADTVRLRGFIGISLFGRTTRWQRVR